MHPQGAGGGGEMLRSPYFLFFCRRSTNAPVCSKNAALLVNSLVVVELAILRDLATV